MSRRGCLLLLLLALLLSSCRPAASTHILFIGNSYTYYNGGLDQLVERLDRSISAGSVTAGGYTLQDHLAGEDALAAIRSGEWDYVVLQEQSQRPVLDPTSFFNAARDLDVEIRAAGAQTVLLMTWERPDSAAYGVTTANLAAEYERVGRTLDVKVAPAGLAFARARQERPALLLSTDDGHPTEAGTYLAACVVYATIFEKSPVGMDYAPRGIPEDVRLFLQQVAAETTGY